jgi:hypothetical protein
MTSIFVGSDLSYEVKQRTSFLFQVAAATTPHQKVRREVIHMSPRGRVDECAHGELDNRMHRVVADPGDFTLSYRAEIELSAEVMGSERTRRDRASRRQQSCCPSSIRAAIASRIRSSSYEGFPASCRGIRVLGHLRLTYSHLDYSSAAPA